MFMLRATPGHATSSCMVRSKFRLPDLSETNEGQIFIFGTDLKLLI